MSGPNLPRDYDLVGTLTKRLLYGAALALALFVACSGEAQRTNERPPLHREVTLTQ